MKTIWPKWEICALAEASTTNTTPKRRATGVRWFETVVLRSGEVEEGTIGSEIRAIFLRTTAEVKMKNSAQAQA
jgi:hypothetical protein